MGAVVIKNTKDDGFSMQLLCLKLAAQQNIGD